MMLSWSTCSPHSVETLSMRGLRQIALRIFVSSLGGDVKARPIVLTLALCFIGVGVCFAQNLFMGIWKLNEAKSKTCAWDDAEQQGRLRDRGHRF